MLNQRWNARAVLTLLVCLVVKRLFRDLTMNSVSLHEIIYDLIQSQVLNLSLIGRKNKSPELTSIYYFFFSQNGDTCIQVKTCRNLQIEVLFLIFVASDWQVCDRRMVHLSVHICVNVSFISSFECDFLQTVSAVTSRLSICHALKNCSYFLRLCSVSSGLLAYLFLLKHQPQGLALFPTNSLRKHAYSNIVKISPAKTQNLQIKILWYFSYFCSKHWLWVLVRTASERRF